jgi:transcriptional regulator with XRE-family HTH domain
MEKNCNHKGKGVSAKVVPRFNASDILGTPFAVFLHDAVEEKICNKCEDVVGHIVPNPQGLNSVVAVLRATEPTKLTGKDIRFLRKSLCKKAKEVADVLALTPEQFSRFENDKQPISPVYERLLRAVVCLGHIDTAKELEVDVKSLLSLRIPSARLSSHKYELHLKLTHSSDHMSTNNVPSTEKDSNGTWLCRLDTAC